MNIKVKIFSVILAMGLVCASLSVSAQSLNEAESKKAEIKSSLDKANALVNSLEKSKASTEDKIDSIDDEIDTLEQENKKASKDIVKIGEDINDISNDIEKTKESLAKQQEDMSIRIVYAYENGRYNLLDALFTSKNLGEFINCLQFTIDLAKYDSEVMEKYEQTLQVFSEQTDALAKKQEDAKRLTKENEDRLTAISALKEAKEGELSAIGEELTDAKEIAAVYEKEMQAQNEVLAALQQAIAAEQAKPDPAPQEATNQNNSAEPNDQSAPENNSQQPSSNQNTTPSVSTSGFVWPCPASRRITSEFGPRQSPTEGASTNHKGIDIGAPTGSSIVAAQAGTVILSQFSNSAGNYIIVSHGKNANGKVVCSVYMHCSARLVSVGQKVERGQEIAKVGSTGYSTGPHLHFGVSEDGAYVNPWNYLK